MTPAVADRPRRKVRFVAARLENIDSARCVVQVEFHRGDGSVRAEAEGICGARTGIRYAAQATARALEQMGHQVKLREVDTLDVLGSESVVAKVAASHEGESRDLVGFCASGNDPVRAGVLAVLNATNRFLDIG